MRKKTHNLLIISSAAWLGLAAAPGFAETAKNISDETELARATANSGQNLVIGKFRLVRNGEESKLSGGLFAGDATMKLRKIDDNRKIVAKIGPGGDFAWSLEPGEYQVSRITFDNFGEKTTAHSTVYFSVDESSTATYLGTLTLTASFETGYYGLRGKLERLQISDECAQECAPRMQQLGLSAEVPAVSLFREEGRIARSGQ